MHGTLIMIAAVVGSFLSVAEGGRACAGGWQQPSVLGLRLP
jgi:hypothetical protein